jgi:hypothetical protein
VGFHLLNQHLLDRFVISVSMALEKVETRSNTSVVVTFGHGFLACCLV